MLVPNMRTLKTPHLFLFCTSGLENRCCWQADSRHFNTVPCVQLADSDTGGPWVMRGIRFLSSALADVRVP